ncbi:acyltransferase [Pseudomonas gingeri]|uniref:acyltransferase family protein n=1 Tax=Pseudomonas gingeri TaxID=117681 RepID=UPI00159F939A|nr:acyltransferase [Pseudomonas gingeri]NWD77520.1 acyltransferase [Pseudomonas gingeri]
MSANANERIVFLDYMRVFAFISVLIGHKFEPEMAAMLSASTDNAVLHTIANFLYNICYGGAAGVIVFFITSGYIITHVLQTESPSDFLIKRFFRIYPLYIAAVIIEALTYYPLTGTIETSLKVLIPRTLLIGDFFDTPYALGGVEWTLRIELMFYLFMTLLKATGILGRTTWLPLVLLAATLTLYALPQIPAADQWLHGYFTLYAPFLFIGICLYLLQTKKSPAYLCLPVIIIITEFFIRELAILHPAWSVFNFAIPAILIFISAWLGRKHLPDSRALRLLSNMTYSIYLFHNWLWKIITKTLKTHEIDYLPVKLQALIVLFLVCYLAHKTIELNAIKAGKYLTVYFKKKKACPAETSQAT